LTPNIDRIPDVTLFPYTANVHINGKLMKVHSLTFSNILNDLYALSKIAFCVDSMMEMIKVRYSDEAKDPETGKSLLPHPYKPWTEPSNDKQKAIFDKAYRSFKMFENVKEWTFMSLPLMWTFAVYGKSVTSGMRSMFGVNAKDCYVDGLVVVSALLYSITNRQYSKGYVRSPEERVQPFYLRTNVVKFWLFGSGSSLVYTFLQTLNVVP
jgi:hypothetical protein